MASPNRQILDAEWPAGHFAAHAQRIINIKLHRGGQRRFARHPWQRERSEARLGGKIGCPLHTAEAHRPAPTARAADRVAEAQAGELHRLVERPGGIQTDDVNMPAQVPRQNMGLAGTPAGEPAQFKQPAGRCSPLCRIGRHIVIKKAAERRRGGRTEVGHRSL